MNKTVIGRRPGLRNPATDCIKRWKSEKEAKFRASRLFTAEFFRGQEKNGSIYEISSVYVGPVLFHSHFLISCEIFIHSVRSRPLRRRNRLKRPKRRNSTLMVKKKEVRRHPDEKNSRCRPVFSSFFRNKPNF